VDGVLVNNGHLLEDMTPPVNPPMEISDETDKKPTDWDDRENIVDPTSKRPEDWDEDAPAMIPDQSARMPTGWLEDEEVPYTLFHFLRINLIRTNVLERFLILFYS